MFPSFPSASPLFHFWLSFHFWLGQNQKSRSSVFFYSGTKRKHGERLLLHLKSNPIGNTHRSINHGKWLVSMHVTNPGNKPASWPLNGRLSAAKMRFTQSKVRMLHALCSASNLRAREKRRKTSVQADSQGHVSPVSRAYDVLFGLSTLITNRIVEINYIYICKSV